MKTSTRNQYRKLLSQLKRWSILNLNQPDIIKITRDDIKDYEMYLIDECQLSPRSVNNHRQAINLFYAYLKIDIRLTLRSVPANKTVIDTISREQVQLIIEAVPEFYQPILKIMYTELVPPGQAVKRFPSPRCNHISLQAVNNQIAIATRGLNITKRVRAKTLHQSGIIHRLEDDGPAVVCELTKLKPGTIARYLKYISI